MDKGHWLFPHNFNIDDWYGFIYCVTNTINGRMYIGKKAFKHRRALPPLKGRKNRRIRYVESDWKVYTGSSNDLNKDINSFHHDSFLYSIESLHESKASLGYREVERLVEVDALRNEQYYNKAIPAIKYIPPITTLKELQFRQNQLP